MPDAPSSRAEPDPEFADRLERLLLQRLSASVDGPRPRRGVTESDGPIYANTDDHEGATIMLKTEDRRTDDQPVSSRRRRSGPWLVVAAAAAMVVVVIAAASIAIRSEDPARVATDAPRPSATTEQYGSVVREHSAAIQAWIDSEESCDHVECPLAVYVHERYAELGPLLKGFIQALAELPSAPDEIAALVARTKAQVKAAANSVDLMVTCGAPSADSPDTCGDERSEVEAAYKRLPAMFAEWSPYT
jgi:hypothetical protein